MLVASVPVPGGVALPMGRAQVGVEANPVGDALDQPARAGSLGIILEAVDHFVGEDAHDLCGTAVGRDAGDVGHGEVDLFVVVVEVGARGVGDAAHGTEDEGDGAGWWDVGCVVGRGLVEEGEDGPDGGCEGGAGVHGGEEVGCGRVVEVADLEAELGEGKVRDGTGVIAGADGGV